MQKYSPEIICSNFSIVIEAKSYRILLPNLGGTTNYYIGDARPRKYICLEIYRK